MTRKRPPAPPPDEPEKKERVIHTRVPESLETELRKRAEGLGISVSNLVRNVLGHAFGLVGDVVADSHAIARAVAAPAIDPVTRGARAARGQRLRVEVVAWQPIVMAKHGACAHCQQPLARGEQAALGVTEDGSPGPIVCSSCKENEDGDR